MAATKQIEDIKPVEKVTKLSGALTISQAGTVLPSTMGEVTELAQYMSKAGALLPSHLRENPAMCMGVIMDAVAWRMNPFRLATQHMVVNGVGSYMSQAITAIINQNAVIKGKLVPKYEGTGDNLLCRLEPVSNEGQTLPYESPKVKDITPKNSPLWKSDVQQQLFYYSARAWCRRYFPELLMGVYDPDEARAMKDVTPDKPVTNFLNDDEAEPHEGEVLPPADEPNHERKYKPGDMVRLEPEGGPAVNVTVESPAFDVAACLSKINSFTDHGALLGWWAEVDGDACPDGEWPKVLSAYEAKRDELEPL